MTCRGLRPVRGLIFFSETEQRWTYQLIGLHNTRDGKEYTDVPLEYTGRQSNTAWPVVE